MERGEETNIVDSIEVAKNYYNSTDADHFYEQVWGGEDIHVGIYSEPGDSIREASCRTVQLMMKSLKVALDKDTKLLDIGSGYGGAARQIVSESGSEIVCLNLSERENRLNSKKNAISGLGDKIMVVPGNFEDLPFQGDYFNVVWSEDAILHSPDKSSVFREVDRVLRKNGEFIFTDPIQADDCPTGVLEPIYARIHLQSLGSESFYKKLGESLGWKFLGFQDLSEHLTKHYSTVSLELISRHNDLSKTISPSFLERMKEGLSHWVKGGEKGYLRWGIFHFQKV